MTMDAPALAPLLRGYFLDRLIRQYNASPATVAAYRDSFRLLLRFAEKHLHRSAASLTTNHLGAPLILAFLDHLERDRGNTIRTRNARLAAIHSFVTYVGREEPAALVQVQRVLAIPSKRCARPVLGYLSRDEVREVLAAPNASTWSGRRDHVLFATLYNTGARVSEAIGLDVGQLHLDRTPRVCLRGKGRKERTVPLWKSTARALARWIRDQKTPPDSPLFPNRQGQRMTRSGVAQRLAQAVAAASSACPLLKGRQISPHTFRHTTAMHLLEPATTSPSSPSGSDTRAPRPRTATSRPTSP
jgi:site-specific recombinase XerD